MLTLISEKEKFVQQTGSQEKKLMSADRKAC
jgi:hypothetical protein